jgi:RimJ/RimL family protein N-acetyltransferase
MPGNDSPSSAYFLQSARLGFRLWSEDDMALAVTLWCDDLVTKFIGGPFSALQAQQRLFKEIALQERYGMQYWPMFLLDTGTFIGCCGLHPYSSGEKIYELGFHLCSQYWARGLAGEAAQAIIKYAFDTYTPVALFAGHHPQNLASKRLLEKLNFRYTHDELYPPTGMQHSSYLLTAIDYHHLNL